MTIKKTHEFLGLTITDNANGRAFIKKVKSEDKNVEDNIKPGDHITAINAESTVGLRHYEVAKAIRLLPKDTNFTMQLMEPKYSDRFVDLLSLERGINISSLSYDDNSFEIKNHHQHELCEAVSLNSAYNDLINSSLPMDKLLSKSCYDNSKVRSENIDHHDVYKETIDRINSMLESFLGINDNLLAIRIYRLARENKNYDEFSSAFKASELNVFNFDDEMKDHLWKCSKNSPI